MTADGDCPRLAPRPTVACDDPMRETDMMFTDEEQILRDTLRSFSKEKLLGSYQRRGAEPFPGDLVRTLGGLGVLGLRVPEAFGGSEGSYVALGIAAEELGRGDFNITSLLQLNTIASVVLERASEELRRAWLPRIASGDVVMSLALTEPGAGSDAAAITTTARADGNEVIISGEKSSITFAGYSQACLVFARTGGEGARGISVFLVPLDAPGVTRTVYDSHGGHPTQRGSLFFDDVRVPVTHRVGEAGTGFGAAMTAFDFNRAIIALACVGAAAQSLDETIEYVKVRETFGEPLATRQGVSFQIAEHLSHIHAARLVAYHALQLAEHVVRQASARNPRRRILEDRVQRLDGARTLERRFPTQQLEEQAPEAEDVGAWVDAFAAHLLRGHVRRRPDEAARIGVVEGRRFRPAVHDPGRLEHLGQTEVDDLGVTRLGDHDVRRLEVAVHDAVSVSLGERLGQLHRDTEGGPTSERAIPYPRLQRVAPDQLHRDVGHSVRLVDLVDDRDRRVLQGGSRPRFREQPAAQLGVLDQLGGEHLESHQALQSRVAGAVDDSHSAVTQLFFYVVMG